MFITFEGVEGSGKTTQINLLHERLAVSGFTVILTHEPGGTAAGTAIRQILLRSGAGPLNPLTELLLFSASRSELVSSVIIPALLENKIVLCDRFIDSTFAYQGHARGLDMESIRQLNQLVTGGLLPDRTILLDLPAEAGLDRATARMLRHKTTEARFEEEGLKFHEKVREGFLAAAGENPERIRVVDASGGVTDVHQRILDALKDILPLG